MRTFLLFRLKHLKFKAPLARSFRWNAITKEPTARGGELPHWGRQQESASPYKVSHSETARLGFEPVSATGRRAGRFSANTIKIRSTVKADLIFMAPATGISLTPRGFPR